MQGRGGDGGYHTWIRYVPGANCNGEYYGDEPFKEMIVTGSGAAPWYDQAGKDGGIVGHFVDIVYPAGGGKPVECARPRSRSLGWTEAGLAIVIEARSGERYELPLQPGDSIPVAMLANELANKVPVKQAVWTGSSIAAIWSKKKLQVVVMGRGDLSTGAKAQLHCVRFSPAPGLLLGYPRSRPTRDASARIWHDDGREAPGHLV